MMLSIYSIFQQAQLHTCQMSINSWWQKLLTWNLWR
jgi:hypothetical protein